MVISVSPASSGRGFLVLVLLILAGAGAEAGTVVLNNGDRLSGEVDSISGGRLLLDTEYAGRVPIRLDAIESVTSPVEFHVRLRGGGYLDGQACGKRRCATPDERWPRVAAHRSCRNLQREPPRRCAGGPGQRLEHPGGPGSGALHRKQRNGIREPAGAIDPGARLDRARLDAAPEPRGGRQRGLQGTTGFRLRLQAVFHGQVVCVGQRRSTTATS